MIGTLGDMWVPALGVHMHQCPTRPCIRLVVTGAMYCCGECQEADERGHDPDHSAFCDERHPERTAKIAEWSRATKTLFGSGHYDATAALAGLPFGPHDPADCNYNCPRFWDNTPTTTTPKETP